MRVWVAEAREATAVARLLVEFGEGLGSSPPPLAEVEASVRRIMAGDDGEFLVGSSGDGEDPAGVCQIRFRLSVWKSAEDCWLEDLFVREEARGAGLGRALVEAAMARARERGCRRIELDVNESNAPARALYAACGFTDHKGPGQSLFIGRAL
ncbi:MAG TPA: GNAT family N-acetyltransferase [Thermoleophilaceae bacterium]|nr:GNAT family N-acetyltransferase [Thermoleophilaceae bacterium]